MSKSSATKSKTKIFSFSKRGQSPLRRYRQTSELHCFFISKGRLKKLPFALHCQYAPTPTAGLHPATPRRSPEKSAFTNVNMNQSGTDTGFPLKHELPRMVQFMTNISSTADSKEEKLLLADLEEAPSKRDKMAVQIQSLSVRYDFAGRRRFGSMPRAISLA